MLDSIKSFLKFVELDSKITRCKIDKLSFENEIKIFNQNIIDLNNFLKSKSEIISALKKECHSIEVDIKSIDQKIKIIKSQLESASNVKEYNSSQKEHIDLEKQKIAKDDLLLTYWNRLDNEISDFSRINLEKLSEIDNLKLKLNESEKRVNKLDIIMQDYEIQKNEFLPLADKEYIQEYFQMLTMISNPVVPVIKNNCSGCFYSLSSPCLSKINNGKIIKCDQCYRLLYSLEIV